ncbi:MAG: hypothetical protein QM757_46670 [Paludibaculum sp.]
MNPDYQWIKTSGIIIEKKWGNLPGGECFDDSWRSERPFVDRWCGRRLSLR